ncbi:MAG: ribulose-phosphate 3-epimerase [Acidobacteria bacterium]|nr:ribulose-phosphate 3-epimerase [Acidobacteriota bacterium]
MNRNLEQPLLSASVLGANWLAFGEAVSIAETSGADLLQIDVADGIFTPTITFGEELVRRIRAATSLPIEVHLMVSRPQDWISMMADVGADYIIFHYEAVQRLQGIVDQVRKRGVGVGIALNSETPAEVLEYVLPYIDLVTVMAILPGFAGQKFIPEAMEKVTRLRRLIDKTGSKACIEIDGGIKAQNISSVVEAGADIVVASSAIYQTPDPALATTDLKQRMKTGWDIANRKGNVLQFVTQAQDLVQRRLRSHSNDDSVALV